MFVTVNNFHYFSTVRFMTSPDDDTSVCCLANDCRLLLFTSIRVVHCDQAKSWTSEKSWFDFGQGQVKASRSTMELPSHPLHASREQCGRGAELTSQTTSCRGQEEVQLHVHSPKLPWRTEEQLLPIHPTQIILLTAMFLFNHGFHFGLYFDIKVSY
jgi:hypothetical protein